MYKLSKTQDALIEQLQIGEEIVDIHINIQKISINFNMKYKEIERLNNEMNSASIDEKLDLFRKVNKAYADLLIDIVGEEVYLKIRKFYEDDDIAVITNLTPFLTDCVIPKIAEYNKEIIKKYKK